MTNARNRHHHLRLLAVAILSLTIVAVGCSPSSIEPRVSGAEPAAGTERVHLFGTHAEYSSIEALAKASDVVVVATVGDDVRRAIEGDPDVPDSGIPMMYREFSVNEVLSDPSGYVQGDVIYVSLFDTDKLIVDEQKAIASGQQLLLFLDRVSVDEVPAIRPLDQVFSPLSSDNGVFDLSSTGEITARSPAVVSLLANAGTRGSETVVVGPDGEEKPAPSTTAFSAPLAQIRDLVNASG